jgi:hypothetical protein
MLDVWYENCLNVIFVTIQGSTSSGSGGALIATDLISAPKGSVSGGSVGASRDDEQLQDSSGDELD